MALLPILHIPDPRLRQVTEPVGEIDDALRKLVSDMFDTMYDAPGIGLAAPQIGVMQRIVVIDCAKRASDEDETDEDIAEAEADDAEIEEEEEEEPTEPDPIVLINPEILWFSDETSVYEEGCLSIPDYYEDVERPASIKVRYTDMDGKVVEREADSLLSTCIQHEVDHLDGKLFIDYLSRLKRERITKKFQKAAKRAADE